MRLAIESITLLKSKDWKSSKFIFTTESHNSETNKEDLVQGGACGGEGAGCVCQDPAHLLRHPDVRLSTSTSICIAIICTLCLNSYVPGKDTRVEVGGTANAKADNTDLGV